jgi:hypothetical protein
VKVDEEDVPSRTVLRDFEEIDDSLEPALSGHRARDVCQCDRYDRTDHDVAVAHLIAPSYFDVAALPDPNGAGDLAPADSLTKLFGKDHVRLVSRA